MIRNVYILAIIALLLASCQSEPSLQKYYVEHANTPRFSTLDIAPSIIKGGSLPLTDQERDAISALKKFNVLLYKADSTNTAEFEKEKNNVKSLLNSGDYEELMKFSSGGMGASVSTLGDGNTIDEFVVFAYNKDNGFGVIRVMGDDITPGDIMAIVGLMQKGAIDTGQLEPIRKLM